MNNAFAGCTGLTTLSATDTPDLSGVTDMTSMFNGATNFNSDISGWDVSTITDMNTLFYGALSFNQDIGNWHVSNVTDMSSMFNGASSFNQNISNWNISKVTTMAAMFYGATAFNNGGQDLVWVTNTSNVTNMSYMFYLATAFNKDISSWDVSSVTDMDYMFQGATAFNNGGNALSWGTKTSKVTSMNNMFYSAISFNQDISGWDVSNVTSMSSMFEGATVFNQDIGDWNVANVTNMNSMFYYATSFNQDLSSWNVGNVTNMAGMFGNAHNFNNGDSGNDSSHPLTWGSYTSNVTDMGLMFGWDYAFNQDISDWDTSNVISMRYMFYSTVFNQNIDNWNVSKVTDMTDMFSADDVFNQPLDSWNVSNVTQMYGMFESASDFNQPLDSWNVGAVTDMGSMFQSESSFNQDIHSWNVGNVTDMSGMFYGASSFDQNVSAWNIQNVTDMTNMFNYGGLSTANYDALLVGWSGETVRASVPFNVGTTEYCPGIAATDRAILTNSPNNWTIADGGVSSSCGGVTDISSVSVTGFVAPVAGQTPESSGSLNSGSAAYTVTGLTWSPTDNPFFASTQYVATVTLTSSAGYEFPAGGIASPTADGGGTVSAGTTTGTGSGNTLAFTVAFPETTSNSLSVISSLNLGGFPAPYYGDTPPSSVSSNSPDYSVTSISWSPTDNPFQSNTEYTATITVTAAAGYEFLPDGVPVYDINMVFTGSGAFGNEMVSGTGSGNSLSFTVTFPNNSQSVLSYAPGPGGSLTGNASQIVANGDSGTAVTAVPNAGYRFVNWSDNSTQNPRTDTNVTGDISVTANFAPIVVPYTLSYTAGPGGSIVGTASQTIDSGDNGTAVTAVPDSGYIFVNWTGTQTTTENPLTNDDVTEDITETANFALVPASTFISSSFSGGSAYVCTDSTALNYDTYSSPGNTGCVYGSKPQTVPFQFLSNLKEGEKSSDVLRLQQFLNSQGYFVAKSGAGSPGKETDYFGSRTKQVLVNYQKAHGISATGYFGPVTRAYVNKHLNI